MFQVITPPKLLLTPEAAVYLKDQHGLTVAPQVIVQMALVW